MIVISKSSPLKKANLFASSFISGTGYAVVNSTGQHLNTHRRILKSSVTNTLHQEEEFRWNCLKFIDSHLKSSILAGLIPRSQLWFIPYLKRGEHPGNVAQVSIHLDVIDRVHKLTDNYLKELLKFEHSLAKSSREHSTQIVKEITYGANYIVIFEKRIPTPEEREDVESELYLGVEKVIRDLIDCNFESSKEKYPSTLVESTTCCIYSSLHADNPRTVTFSDCIASLKNELSPLNRRGLVPIEMILQPFPGFLNRLTSFRAISLELANTVFLLNSALIKIQDKCRKLLQDALLLRVPFLSDRLKEFERCLEKLTTELTLGVVDYRRGKWTPTQMGIVFKHFWNSYFDGDDLTKWVLTRRSELNAIKYVLSDVSLPLVTESQLTSYTNCSMKVFFLQTVTVEDPLIVRLRKELNLGDLSVNSWIEFKLTSSTHQEALHQQLLKFQEKILYLPTV